MSIFQLPPSRCPCKEFLISWFLPPNNLGGKKSVKFFWKCKFRVYNAVSSLGIGVRMRVTRYNWHGIKPHAVSICHFFQKAKNQLHARCLKSLPTHWISFIHSFSRQFRVIIFYPLSRLLCCVVYWQADEEYFYWPIKNNQPMRIFLSVVLCLYNNVLLVQDSRLE